jgi:hypothetical protein
MTGEKADSRWHDRLIVLALLAAVAELASANIIQK